MAKKIKLVIRSSDEYRLIAVVSHLKDYKLAFEINQNLDLDLVRYDDLAYAVSGDIMCTYAWYRFEDSSSHAVFYLIGSKHQGGNLIPSAKSADFFMLIKNHPDPQEIKQYLAKLRTIPNVITAVEVKPDTVKDIDMLLDINELHEMEQLNKR
jgi:hypothetical protein